jgi:hypothetical protein
VLDAFALLLPSIEDRNDSAFKATLSLMKKHLWLCWPILHMIESKVDQLPDHLSTVHSILPLLCAHSCLLRSTHKEEEELERVNFPVSSLIYFNKVKDAISENWAMELKGINWSILNEKKIYNQFPFIVDDGNKGINFRQYLIDRIEHPEIYANDVALYISFVHSLYDLTQMSSQGRKLNKSISYTQNVFRQSFVLSHIFNKFGRQAKDWNQRRTMQWLECFLLLNACKYPKAKDSITYNTAKSLLISEDRDGLAKDLDVVKKDKTISQLEQSDLPREVFRELRTDLDNIKSIMQDTSLRKIYLGEHLTIDRIPTNEKEAQKLWHQLIPQINDQLLTSIHQ